MNSRSTAHLNFTRRCDAANLEIGIHQILFAVIVLPLVTVIFPSMILALGLYMVMHVTPAMGRLAELYWHALLLSSAAALTFIGVTWGICAMRPSASRTKRRLRSVQGKAGEVLTAAVLDLWEASGQNTRRAPEIFVFSNLNVIASAVQSGHRMGLHLSTGLWERIMQGDAVGRGILAHEVAHLIRRDPLRFRALEGAAAGIEATSRTMRAFLAIVSAVLIADIIVANLSVGEAARLLPRLSAALILTVVVYLSPLLLGTIGRRYAAFIIALMEMRADLEADRLMGGGGAFGNAIAKDRDFREMSLAELRHSLISPSLTHISMSERAVLLASPDRLETPKLRYFAVSLLLAALLPLNPITPLMFGGALDHLLVLIVNVALQIATVGMIIVCANPIGTGVSASRTFQLALVLTFASIATQISLYVVGYLVFSFTLDMAVLGTFSDTPPTLSRLVSDATTTWQDLSAQLWDAAGGFDFILALFATAASLFVLSYSAKKIRSGTIGMAFLPMLAAAATTIFSGYDDFRDTFYAFYPLTLASKWFEGTEHMVWLRISAPAISALLVFLAQAVLLRYFAWTPPVARD